MKPDDSRKSGRPPALLSAVEIDESAHTGNKGNNGDAFTGSLLPDMCEGIQQRCASEKQRYHSSPQGRKKMSMHHNTCTNRTY